MISAAPLPFPDGDTGPYWAAAAKGDLVIQACADCGRLRHPPRPMCPRCRSMSSKWQEMSGRATVWSYVVAHPPLLPAFAEFAPYNVCVVALEEDSEIRLVGNLVAAPGAPINSVDPSTIAIGERVHVVFDQVADDVGLPRFIRATELVGKG